MRGLITICARGGSKGIPGKNIKLINGKALITYSIEVALSLAEDENIDIYLSTDSIEIRDVVRSLGYSTINTSYERPGFLASDTAGKLEAIADVKNYAEKQNDYKYDFVIDLDVTSPFRSVEDLKKAIDLLFDNEAALNIFSVSPANRNPYFNMVEKQENGFFGLCKVGQFLTRQSAPKVYDMNASFYIFKKAFFEEGYKTVISERSLVCELPHICFDLDHPIDFEFMSYLLENKKLDFKFNY
ncbi:acylneuraminate cytidylyltransferase family protein [Sphingobacterium sp. InxBP1]|uniref:acylneuraminate cytidylyltransferase family protein n=1 Tax=Sphingobacterium sp. InxBP1 TaxID=2870328 RepID=UPI00224318F9|nr:acylneuraminate cytidylyltransferase family protein [Sphingobacterium sp. InxBP1]MCW8310903.1 acylneuraminate cytidylyltransferase family protein [Sphingobacterium sp. InxBP1]